MDKKQNIYNSKILFQIGLAITLVFLVGLLLCVHYVISNMEYLILSSKKEPIKNDYREIEHYLSDIYKYPEITEYWLEHPEETQKPLTEKEKLSVPEINEKTLHNEEDLNLLARYYYEYDHDTFSLFLEDPYYDYFFCIKIDDEGMGCVLLSYSRDTDEVWALGEVFDGDFLKREPVIKLFTGDYDTFTYEVTGKLLTPMAYSYKPVFDDNGNINCFLVFHYNMDDIISFVIQSAFEIGIISIVVILVLLDIIVLVYLHVTTTKQLGIIEKAFQSYMDNKDSTEVVESMDNIKSKNELGLLADDVSVLAVELDNYTNDNIRLAAEKERVKSSLELAAKIQDDYLIKTFPERDDLMLFASMTPAREVGGDFYDFFFPDDHHLVLTIADVSGKGIPASLVMMSAMTSIRNYSKLLNDPSEILEHVNNDLCRKNSMNMFVTAWLGILDIDTGKLITSNAGHEFPAINEDGSYKLFKDKHGFVLGGMNGMKYKNEELYLKPGNSIFVYTDGVPEATDADNQLYGTDRMLEALNSLPEGNPKDMLKTVKDDVDLFVGEAPQFDDLTMLCLKYLGNNK